jgi:hypothetical protein
LKLKIAAIIARSDAALNDDLLDSMAYILP